jgi:hypothetical protein
MFGKCVTRVVCLLVLVCGVLPKAMPRRDVLFGSPQHPVPKRTNNMIKVHAPLSLGLVYRWLPWFP